ATSQVSTGSGFGSGRARMVSVTVLLAWQEWWGRVSLWPGPGRWCGSHPVREDRLDGVLLRIAAPPPAALVPLVELEDHLDEVGHLFVGGLVDAHEEGPVHLLLGVELA